MFLWIMFLGLAVLGIILLIVSNIMYFKRTKDQQLSRFWLGKELLTQNEYVMNRGGFVLTLVSIVVMCLLPIFFAQ